MYRMSDITARSPLGDADTHANELGNRRFRPVSRPRPPTHQLSLLRSTARQRTVWGTVHQSEGSLVRPARELGMGLGIVIGSGVKINCIFGYVGLWRWRPLAMTNRNLTIFELVPLSTMTCSQWVKDPPACMWLSVHHPMLTKSFEVCCTCFIWDMRIWWCRYYTMWVMYDIMRNLQ